MSVPTVTKLLEGNTRVKPKSRIRGGKVYLSNEERSTLISKLGDAGYILCEFYYSKYGVPDYLYSDISAARALGWSIRKVQRTRIGLINIGWFLQETAIYPDKRRIRTTYLGPDIIKKHLEGQDLSEEKRIKLENNCS